MQETPDQRAEVEQGTAAAAADDTRQPRQASMTLHNPPLSVYFSHFAFPQSLIVLGVTLLNMFVLPLTLIAVRLKHTLYRLYAIVNSRFGQ